MVVSPTAPASLPDSGRFVALDSLRGVAALGVALFHIQSVSPLTANPVALNGRLFVDFFFVLSGFVIAAAYGEKLSGGFSPLRFMALRLGRVYPLHLVMVLAYLALEFAVAAWGIGGREAFTGTHSPARLAEALTLTQAWHPDPSNFYNGQSWSISVEVILYLLAALLFRLTGRAWMLFLPLALAAIMLVGAQWNEPVVTGSILRGVAGFGIGTACHAAWRRGLIAVPGGHAGTLVESVALAIVIVLFVTHPGGLERYGAMIAGFAVVVFVFAHEAGMVSRTILHSRFAVLLGTMSYSLYMVHGMVIGRMTDLIEWTAPAFGWHPLIVTHSGTIRIERLVAPEPWSSLIVVLMLGTTIAVSLLTWRFVEEPCRLWSRRRAARFGAAAEEASAPAI